MPRRAGKAASRRARQRGSQRQRQRPSAPPPAAERADAVPPVGTPDAREAESLDPPRRSTPPAAINGSRLTTAEVSEYHYVERDLRNIGILTGVLVVLLLVAWAVFRALGLIN